jgi:hypothetical protein
MTAQHTFLDEDIDSLFTLIAQTCADCGQPFEASRRTPRCATCASLRTGQVGAATVVCPVCDIEHQIPILKPHKLCLSCSADMTMTLASARVRYDRAREAADALSVQLDADVAHADDATQARFAAAVALRITGRHGETTYTQTQVDAAWRRALEKGDTLSALLSLYDRAAAAALAVERAGAAMRAVEEAIEL